MTDLGLKSSKTVTFQGSSPSAIRHSIGESSLGRKSRDRRTIFLQINFWHQIQGRVVFPSRPLHHQPRVDKKPPTQSATALHVRSSDTHAP
jgi:hypothetical protein